MSYITLIMNLINITKAHIMSVNATTDVICVTPKIFPV